MQRMMRRLITLLGVVTLLAAPAARADNAAPPQKPNFLIIMADDLGYADLSCYGNERFRTPHLDRLAKVGLRFTDFHSNGTVCSPTRAALLTGRYQHRAGLAEVVFARFDRNRQDGLFPKKELTFADLLKEQGYATGIFGKWHLGYRKKFNPTRNGFDRFVGFVSGNIDYQSHIDGVGVHDWWHGPKKEHESGYQTKLTTDHAIDFIKAHRDQPFVCYVPYAAPHFPYQGPDDPPVRRQGSTKSLYNHRKPSHARPAYKAMVRSMDRGIGRMAATLKRLNLARDTLVFFCSDNGPTGPGRAGPLRGKKASVWEGGHRVPAIAWWPGRIEPGTSDQLAMTMDLMPTMLDLAGASAPPDHPLDGRSLRGVLLKGRSLHERTVFWNRPRSGNSAVRQGPWKLIIAQRGADSLPKLFNLEEDRAEQHDVSEQYPQRVQRLRQRFRQWKQAVTTNATQQPTERLKPPVRLR